MLIKQELICQSCSKQYIIICNEDDQSEISNCPFCTMPVDEVPFVDEEE